MLTTLINPDNEAAEVALRLEEAEAERRALEVCECGEREKECGREDFDCQRFTYVI